MAFFDKVLPKVHFDQVLHLWVDYCEGCSYHLAEVMQFHRPWFEEQFAQPDRRDLLIGFMINGNEPEECSISPETLNILKLMDSEDEADMMELADAYEGYMEIVQPEPFEESMFDF